MRTNVALNRTVIDDADARALCEAPRGGGKVEALVLRDEVEDAATLAAAEAVETLARGIDSEGRGFLLVEGAQGLEGGPRALEREVAADDIDDVIGGGDRQVLRIGAADVDVAAAGAVGVGGERDPAAGAGRHGRGDGAAVGSGDDGGPAGGRPRRRSWPRPCMCRAAG